jgi:class 3 adenylate cyclase/tetratricopeptide (TPR) repeat protein
MNDDTRGDGAHLSARVGELRRLTIMFCDVVGSTELSGRLEPETYREIMRGYRRACRDVIEARFEGHIVQLKGDGTLSVFGYPLAHENDAERAVRAGLALVAAVRELSPAAGESLDVRVAVHHGLVYLDLDEEDIYGLSANVGARLHSLADPGTVVISEEVRHLVERHFEIEAGEPQTVKGVDEPVQPFRVTAERSFPTWRSWSTPLVERADELELLRQAWMRAAAGTPERAAGLLVQGEAGIGKSRLVGALADEARAAGARVVELHGSPFHVDAGLHPVRTLAEARCGIGADSPGTARLECLAREVTDIGLDAPAAVPLLAPVLGIDPSAGYEPAAAEGRKLEEQVKQAALDYVVACAGGDPAIVLAENLHWFDDATRALLGELLRVGPGRILVVGTSRGPERGLWETIELRPLTPTGRRALIDALKGGLSEEDRDDLATRSGGVPLFVEELVRAGAVRGPRRAVGVAPVPGSVPEALYEPLVARLYSTPTALPVAATAAAVGQEVDRDLLARTMSMPHLELDATLETLVDARVLEPVAGPAPRFQFRHELLREVAYELQPPSWRRKVHSRLCDLLAGDDPSDWHVLASHFERAERLEEAADAYRQTAEWARRRGALDEARAHLTRAIDLVASLPDDPERDRREVRLRLRRGFLAMSAEGAGSPDASSDFDRCLALATTDPEPANDYRSTTLIGLWAYYLARADLERARELSVALRSALQGKRSVFRPQNLASFGMLDWFEGSFGDSVGTLADAFDVLAATGGEAEVMRAWFVPNDPTASMHVHLALARFMSADLAGADDSIAQANAVAASLDFPQGPWSAAYAAWLGSWMWIEAGRLDIAEQAVEELRSASATHGFAGWGLVGETQLKVLEAMRTMRDGAPDAGVLSAHAEAVGGHADVWQMIQFRLLLPFYLTTTGGLLAAAGDADGARARYEESLALAADTGMRFYDAETMRRMAHLEPDADALVAKLHEALDLARRQAAKPFELRIALDLHGRLGDDARPLLRRAIDAYDDGAATSELDDARARVMIAQ